MQYGTFKSLPEWKTRDRKLKIKKIIKVFKEIFQIHGHQFKPKMFIKCSQE